MSRFESGYQQTTFSLRLAAVLKQFYSRAAKKQATLSMSVTFSFFQISRLVKYVRIPLLNWTRTAALNDAARILWRDRCGS